MSGPVAAPEDAAAPLLFVYGTLRRGCDHAMQRLLEQQGRYAGPAWFAGQLLRVRHYPGVLPSATPGERVRGDLYRLPDPTTTLALLDHYEECTDAFPAPHEYRRERQPVQDADGRTHLAWIYLYNHPATGLAVIPGGDFLAGR